MGRGGGGGGGGGGEGRRGRMEWSGRERERVREDLIDSLQYSQQLPTPLVAYRAAVTAADCPTLVHPP